MPFRRRKRKFNGVWLPPDPYNTVAGIQTGGIIASADANDIKYRLLQLPNAEGFGNAVSYPLIGDLNEEHVVGANTAATGNIYVGATLNDLTFGYSLRRIVGKLWVNVEQDNISDTAAGTWVITAGIMVRRVDEAGQPQEDDIFPDSYESARDPWVWRKQWLLQNSGATPGGIFSQTINPAGNWQYGTVADGPHLDQKTRRTVKSEERLFLDVAAIALDGNDEQTSTACSLVWDFRFFGRVFQSAGNKRNAVR